MDSENPFELVILDLTISGGLGGLFVIDQLKRMDHNVKAVVCSGYSAAPVMNKYWEFGFKGGISKPLTVVQLSRVLHEVLTQS